MTALRIPLMVDIGVVLAGVVAFGMLIQRVDFLSGQMTQLQSAVEADRATTQNGRTGSVDRLARIEERLIVMQEQIAELKKEVRAR